MKKIVIIIVSFLVLVSLGVGAVMLGAPYDNPVELGTAAINVPEELSAIDKQIKVVSFNIRCFAKEENEENNWNNRIDDIVAFFEDEKPDLIGFQELKHPQYKFLIDYLGDEYGFYGIYRSGFNLKIGDYLIKDTQPDPTIFNLLRTSMIGEASAIFYKKSRFELIEADTFWYSKTPERPSKDWNSNFKRIGTHVRLKDHYTDNTFSFINTHLDNKSEKARLESVKIIIDKIAALDEGVILAGDFNFQEDNPGYSSLINGGLTDTRYASEITSTEITSNSYSNTEQGKIIDYIFLTDPHFNALIFDVVTDTASGKDFISDHYPLVSIIEYA